MIRPQYRDIRYDMIYRAITNQLRNKAVEENATSYKCEISPAPNDLNIAQIPKIYIAVQCIFNIFITAFITTNPNSQQQNPNTNTNPNPYPGLILDNTTRLMGLCTFRQIFRIGTVRYAEGL